MDDMEEEMLDEEEGDEPHVSIALFSLKKLSKSENLFKHSNGI